MKNNEVLTSMGNIKKVPKGLKIAEKLGYKKMINFGCGYGYEYHTKEMENLELINYDPYIEKVNNLPEKNIEIDLVVCNNVLNVIEDIEIIQKGS